ncbi:LysM peptidoglycan-binding domain-containing protein [Gudongella sp. DL1XJH-153]|uniref:LysM peptidoglycan-binding domain-containing protein n=1 Tax=Gudongella sp. DL1XJH-153 TaxID=3409804 RepID=UPI003BB50396
MSTKLKSLFSSIKTRPLTKSEKILLTLLAIVGIAYLGNQYILVPQDEKIQALQVEKYELETKISEMNATLRREDDIKKEWELLHRERNQILSYYFPTLDQAQIIYLLNDLLPEDQVEIADLNFSRPSSENVSEMEVFNMGISVPFTGDYTGIEEMVRAIELSPRRMMVDSLSLDRSADNQLSGSMSLKVYSLEGLAEMEEEDVIYVQTAENPDQGTLFSSFDGFVGATANGGTSGTAGSGGTDGGVTSGDGTTGGGTSGGGTGVDGGTTVKGDILHSFEWRNYDFIPSHELVRGQAEPTTIALDGKYALRLEYNILGTEEENRAMVDITSQDIELKYPPTDLSIHTFSFSYAPGTVGVRILNQDGDEQFIPVNEGISWLGWGRSRISLPGSVAEYPIKITHIYYEMAKGRDDFGVLVFDKLEAIYPHHVDYSYEGTDKEADKIFYEVKPGDSVSTISRDIYGTLEYKNEIMRNNDISAGDVLPVGKILVLVKR